MKSLLKAGTHVFGALAATACVTVSTPALADEGHELDSLDHAPIGVMGDHRHKKGEWMVSYRLMHMDMAGIQIGTDSVTPEQVATTVPNRFFGRQVAADIAGLELRLRPPVEVRHAFTHFHLILHLMWAEVAMDAEPATGSFVPATQFRPSDLPTVMRKAFDLTRG